jgi:hypothetical protein
MAFEAKDGQYFWSNGYAWGTVNIQRNGQSAKVELKVLQGELALNTFLLKGFQPYVLKKGVRVKPNEDLKMIVQP